MFHQKFLKTIVEVTHQRHSTCKFASARSTKPLGGGTEGGEHFFSGGVWGALIYAFIFTILPLHECN